jgi:AcrR family transcriptional regulator
MPAEAVGAAHRARLLRAVVGAVADRGYANVRIADIVDRARVSRHSFYAQFDSKEACFLAAHDDAVAVILAELGAQIAVAEMPRAQLAGGIGAYFELADREPEFARCMLTSSRRSVPLGSPPASTPMPGSRPSSPAGMPLPERPSAQPTRGRRSRRGATRPRSEPCTISYSSWSPTRIAGVSVPRRRTRSTPYSRC